MDTTIGYQPIAVKEEARGGGGYDRDVSGYCNARLHMEIYVSVDPFASTMALLLGSTG